MMNEKSDRHIVTELLMWLKKSETPYFLNALGEWRKRISYEEGSVKVGYKEIVDSFLKSNQHGN